ncbi:hypothetical protein A2631_04985 [Candidatus Daviesbacteria bacterium RIFCSPHIGHO2_01_FULL_44_29]|uniref:Uncharacterized protein n=1 Tax=Candidatus Daviesbacteria bacterium RIFCSPHIGHO2_02_FULL_43_12 TaxID=1797776 RepID=A0A1F5KGL9_9BACT|nr:MAG: hypothetical protein A2631_04985 [Candidatus Daviesbacteria bacterium RIFCSPHIGHO2_01_FULL_44_29]OGE40077.1 MAG: hypothetical protein A3D25_04715 [Candidatus Daviesbacteria bacterium RIFCSPHIGHO2_02_FULL_43_12]OGE41442.1 MAG: hypothetical protein A3E86_05095 [Candidatus Daviesbacteria bacterium RIFCSPHIGHO2_12_FULL_47_45]OGE70243.1 MAG: hypothetical protein A3B55_00855 [Candidatus Daviesbacteria bacterium RIFCSPLOWO2_01_FULL_43_15]
MAERPTKKRNSPVIAKVVAAGICPVHGPEVIVQGSGGTPKERQAAMDDLAGQVLPHRERADQSRKRDFVSGPPKNWGASWEPRPIWGQGLASNTKGQRVN